MKIIYQEFFIAKSDLNGEGLCGIKEYFLEHIKPNNPCNIPIRFVVTETTEAGYGCEIDFLVSEKDDNI